MGAPSGWAPMTDSPQTPHTAVFRPNRPLVIGLVGGIASGKSTVANAFVERGLQLVDADREARLATERPDVLAAIADRFGNGVLDADGKLDRAALADVVFRDEDSKRALEEIIHPRVRALLEAQIETAVTAGHSVVLDIPLLVENGWLEHCDACVFVDSSDESRRSRAAGRGWEPGEIERREANQAPLTVKKSHCTYIISNDGPLEATIAQVEGVLRELEAVD